MSDARSEWNDYGHFHTFLRPKGIPAAIRPLELSEETEVDQANDAPCHLVAISMSGAGRPVRLFTTNRWVTGERWYRAADVITMLDRFVVDLSKPSWPLNRWISAMLILYRDHIERLIHERDAAIAQWRAAHPDRDVFEDRALEVTSGLAIDLDAHLAHIRSRLGLDD